MDNYLLNIKSSGIYRFVWDKSEIPGVDAETLRLVVGYSEKGPFNTPVYVKSADEFKNTFGNRSKRLERNGVWFHRMAIQALAKGPIIALNLKPFNGETVQTVKFNPSEVIPEAATKKVTEIYNTQRFWKLEPELLEDGATEESNYIHIAATDSKECSNTVFVRGYKPTGFDITFKDWFEKVQNGGEVPEYIDENAMMSNYFVEVFVFKGQFTPAMINSAALSKYFDASGNLNGSVKNAFGENIDTLYALAQDEASNFIKSYTGIILPDFINTNGSILSIDELFNNDQPLHKMMMRLNQTLLYSKTSDDFKDFDTTGFLGDLSKGEMSVSTLVPVISTFDGSKYGDPEGGTGVNVNFYSYAYTTSEDHITTTATITGLEHTGIQEGDIFIGADGYISVKSISGDVVTFSGNAKDFSNHVYKVASPITYTSQNLKPSYIEGYTYSSVKFNSTSAATKLTAQEAILGTLKDKGLQEALTNKVELDYRYLIDTFEGFVETECKGVLANICKLKDNVLGILNFPSMKTFEKWEAPSFTDASGKFDTKYIAMGGNPQKAMGVRFTLPDETSGASHVAFYTPVLIRDAQTGIKDICPSAALVSNNFMDKYTKYQPYTIIAGPNRGVIRNAELIGPDFNYSRYDLDNLEPFGVNCLVFVPGRGTYINSNQTAKQNPVTSLSKVHVRELCIFLQDEIEKLLQQYHWDFNTPNLRSTIKDRADVILETAKNNGGVYAYLNVCDESNNTDEVINNEMFILSTSIEPTMGAGKMVQELTLYRKGGMSALISE